MDIVSDVAAVVALVESTKKIVGFIQDLKDAKDDRAKIVRELQGCAGILGMIAVTVQQDAQQSLPNLASLVFPGGPLEQYKKDIEELVPKLTTAHGVSDLAKRCKFIASKKDIQDTLTALEHYKNTFIICINLDQT